MGKTIEVKVEDIKRAFDEANDNVRNCILNLFPQIKEDLQITDRVKTFEDACRKTIHLSSLIRTLICVTQRLQMITKMFLHT